MSAWSEQVIDELAEKIVALEPLLRCLPDNTSDPMWLDLHLRLIELGGVPPASWLALEHLIAGFDDRKNQLDE